MGSIPRKLLIGSLWAWILASEQPLVSVGKIRSKDSADVSEFFGAWGSPGERNANGGEVPPAQGVLSDGEVPDSPWYQNRHAKRKMSIRELKRGPGDSRPPSPNGNWKIVSAKTEGVTPGFVIQDSTGRKYILKFDSARYSEIASAADVISSKLLYALGYHVPENYIVSFPADRLTIAMDGDSKKRLTQKQLKAALAYCARDAAGNFRGVASLFLEGEPIGPFHYYGTRSEDPNDRIPHENRRELRGLYLFCAWINHTDSKSGNTLDTIVEENGIRFVRHHLIDFGATLGSNTNKTKSPRQGFEYAIDVKPVLVQMFTLGLYVPKWARVQHSKLRSVGSFEAEAFEPDSWKPTLPNPAFENRLTDDLRWAADKIAAFTNEEIRAIVATGQYSDPAATDWVSKALIGRRDKIVRAYASPEKRVASR